MDRYIALSGISGSKRTSEAGCPSLSKLRQKDQNLDRLINKIGSCDEHAFATLYDETNPLIYGLVLHVLGEEPKAQEVVFDVYCELWSAAARYQASDGTPLTWLVTMARRKALDRLRADDQSRLAYGWTGQGTREDSIADYFKDSLSLLERQKCVRQALNTLASGERQALELAYFAGVQPAEISARLKVPIGMVKAHIRNGMMKLRQQLKP